MRLSCATATTTTTTISLLAAAVLVSLTASPAVAWTLVPHTTAPRTTAPWSSSLLLASTLEGPATAAAAAAADDVAASNNHDNQQQQQQHALDPAYAAALTQIKSKLAASIPEQYASVMLPLLEHFGAEYMAAHQQVAAAAAAKSETKQHPTSSVSADPAAAATRFLTGIQYGLKYGMPQSPDHYTFDDVTHRARRGGDKEDDDPYGGIDFYQFGCDFFAACMDLTSPAVNVLGMEHLEMAVQQVAAGENVVFFANHQSEADPQVVSACLTLAGQSQAAADMVYVAGHKVTTDPLAIPFSMGRNLICIHSKKHIDADPDTKPLKQKQNLKAMNALLAQFKNGGALVWVAPSGGRDRRDLETNTVPMAHFDRKTIDMFRLLGQKSRVPTHYYTLAMVSYDLCPPPDFVAAGTGETRNVRFVPVGVAVGPECVGAGGLESRDTFADTAEAQCRRDYERLLDSLHPKAQK